LKFNEFSGNERVVAYFKKAIARDALAHAFLFSGMDGVGKATLARLICKTLLCRNPGTGAPCDACAACHKFDSGNHPDFHPYVPDGLYFKIEEVRNLIHQVSLKPVESRYKTFVLERADTMREEAANALLKVLEEPPGATLIFLITETSEALLPTIRSRCLHFPFQPLPPQELERRLLEQGHSPQEARAQARFSHGSLGRALTLNVEQYAEMRDRVLLALEGALGGKTYYGLMDAVKGITVERVDMPERLLVLEELSRDLLVLKTSPETRLIHEDARQRLEAFAEGASTSALLEFYENLLQYREAILKINANIGLSLQALLLPLRAASAR
jgi:DNA polymerase-3 subunit delta'